MPYQLNEINRRATQDPKGFLEESDALYQSKIDRAAAAIGENLKESPIVLLSGPSGSGKTTTARKLQQALNARGIRSHAISLDDYFSTVDPAYTPRQSNGEYDFESPYCLDLPLLHEHFTALSRGDEILIPTFCFPRQMRDTSRCTPLKLGKDEVAIFEGIHALNDLISQPHPEAFKIYLSARASVLDGDKTIFKGTWARLSRRAVRDFNFRGVSAQTTMAMWYNVRRGEKAYISPFRDKADLKFDSFLPYEVNVLRTYAQPLFDSIPQENPRREEMLDMVAAFQNFVPIDPDLVAKDSLIREFIGGSSYH